MLGFSQATDLYKVRNMSSLSTLNPLEAIAFLQETMAASRNVQAVFASTRSGTQVFIRGKLERLPDGIGFAVTNGERASITVDPTQASVCMRAGADTAKGHPLAERFLPTLEFTGALILEFKRVETLVVFAICSDKAH
jgi:hypothetical protein